MTIDTADETFGVPPLNPEDFYLNENGLLVFTAQYHLKRGYCCKNGCKHCPYGFKKKRKSELE